MRVRELADQIIESQVRELGEMKLLLKSHESPAPRMTIRPFPKRTFSPLTPPVNVGDFFWIDFWYLFRAARLGNGRVLALDSSLASPLDQSPSKLQAATSAAAGRRLTWR